MTNPTSVSISRSLLIACLVFGLFVIAIVFPSVVFHPNVRAGVTPTPSSVSGSESVGAQAVADDLSLLDADLNSYLGKLQGTSSSAPDVRARIDRIQARLSLLMNRAQSLESTNKRSQQNRNLFRLLKETARLRTEVASIEKLTGVKANGDSHINSKPAPKNSPEGTGAISGTVTDAATSAGILGVSVQIYDATGLFIMSVGTNGSGIYTTTATLNTGTYYALTSNGLGYLNELYNDIPCNNCDPTSGTPISVTSGSTTAGINFALILGGKISGNVKDAATMANLQSITVNVYNSAGVLMTSASTNASGNYTTGAGLQTGTYYVRTNNSLGYINQQYNNTTCVLCTLALGTPISVTVGSTVSGIDFSLTAGGKISGTVTNAATSLPISGIPVQILHPTGIVLGTATTNASGVYTCPVGLTTGSYYVRTNSSSGSVSPPVFINQVYNGVSCQNCNPALGTAVSVTTGLTTTNINFALTAGGRISGTVIDTGTSAPLAGVNVQVYNSGGIAITNGFTDGSGNYLSRVGLPTGTYYVQTFSDHVDKVYNNIGCPGCDVTRAGTPISVTAGATVSGINFSLSTGGSISGTITNAANSAPIGGVEVDIYTPCQGFVTGVVTNGLGNYTTPNSIPTGTYFAVTFSDQGFIAKAYDNSPTCLFCDPTLGTPISVTSGATTTAINFALSIGARISGVVADATNTIPINSSPGVFDANGVLVSQGFQTGFGNYAMLDGLPTGTYYVRAPNQAGYVNELYDNIPCLGCTPTTGTPIALTAGVTTSGINFSLDPGGRILGTVIDATTTAPLPGVFVFVYNSSGTAVASTTSDTFGTYIVGRGLPTDTYYVTTFNLQGYVNKLYNNINCVGCSPPTGTPVSVTTGAITTGINLALVPGGRISGTVTDAATAAPLPNVIMNFYNSSGTFATNTVTDCSGNYTSDDGLTTANYFARTANTIGYIDKLYNNFDCVNCDPTTGTMIPVTIGSNTPGINFSLCRMTLSVDNEFFSPSGGSDSINLTGAGGCTWTAVSNDAWITINSGSSGSGNGTVNYSVSSTGSPRTGTMTVAGHTFTVTQGSTVPAGSYSKVFVASGDTASLTGDIVITGNLALNGDLNTGGFTLTMPNTATSTGTADVIGNVKRTGFTIGVALSFGNPLNRIRFDSGTLPSDVTMNLVKSTPPGFAFNTVSRTYTITPNGGAGFSATLRLHYKDSELNGLDESTLELWRFNGSSWQSPAGSATRDTTQNWVEESGITAFSPWAIAGPSGPTLVELISLTATGYEEGVFLEWQTGFEANNLGFRVYRQQAGALSVLNQELIAGSALTAGSGAALTAGRAYASWVEAKDITNDSSFWLEDVDLNGTSTWHGPFYAKHLGGKPPAHSQAETVSQVGQTNYLGSTRPVERFAQPARWIRSSSSQASLQQAGLASGRAVKIGIRQAGWYRVARAELVNAGLDPKTDPRTLRLFVDGAELPFSVSGEQDGTFDANDTVEFYGLALNTPSTDTRIYWLIAGGQPGLRINKAPFAKGFPSGAGFPYTVERRDRTIYFAALKNGDEENFFGAVITAGGVEQRLTLNNLAPSAREDETIEISLQGVTNLSHQVSVSLNGLAIGRLVFDGQSKAREKIGLFQGMLREGENIVTLHSINGPSDISLVDSIGITYQHSYRADNDALSFEANSGQATTIDGFSSNDVRVFDVTDERYVQELAVSIDQTKDGYAATVTASGVGIGEFGAGVRKLIALTNQRTLRASTIRANTPSGLQQSSNAADFVIISEASLLDSLKPLAELRSKQGLNVALIDIEDIYDEFSFGEKSPQSIKDFLSYATKNWKLQPRYVLLAGDASYDPKNYLGLGARDGVPTKLIDTAYLETASDDWFVDFTEGGLTGLSIGRLPVRTADEASTVVNKLIAYEKSAPSNEVALVADRNDGFDFEQAATSLRRLIPSSLRVYEIFRSMGDDATARSRLLATINRGEKIVNYMGHGSVNVWRGNLLTASDASLLTNRDRLSLFVMMTCLNGYFQDATGDSLGESLLKAENGGAVAVWASSGMTLANEQATINQEFYRVVFSGDRSLTLGEAVNRARLKARDNDVRHTWILFGDPTMRLR